MITLDTNVVSGPLKRDPHPEVLEWLDRQSRATLYSTTITKAELMAGVLAMAAGKRRIELQKIINDELASLFADRMRHWRALCESLRSRR